MAVRRRQMRHVLFTEPEVIEAGTQATPPLLLFWCALSEPQQLDCGMHLAVPSLPQTTRSRRPPLM
jgi:hypothetical protein